MNRAPLTYRASKWTAEEVKRFREIERDYHRRAFGEELARVNLDLSLEERRRYLEWMRHYSQRHRANSFPQPKGKKGARRDFPLVDR